MPKKEGNLLAEMYSLQNIFIVYKIPQNICCLWVATQLLQKIQIVKNTVCLYILWWPVKNVIFENIFFATFSSKIHTVYIH
jgi:hypothetical protein